MTKKHIGVLLMAASAALLSTVTELYGQNEEILLKFHEYGIKKDFSIAGIEDIYHKFSSFYRFNFKNKMDLNRQIDGIQDKFHSLVI